MLNIRLYITYAFNSGKQTVNSFRNLINKWNTHFSTKFILINSIKVHPIYTALATAREYGISILLSENDAHFIILFH